MIHNTRITESEAPTTDLVVLNNNRAVTTSLKVAEVFGKQHFHVMRNIRELILQDAACESNFGLTQHLVQAGAVKRNDEYYTMDRDGFTLLAFGFTGPKALQFKKQYIAAFNEMEATLQAAEVAPDLVSIDTVRFLLAEYDKKDAEVKQLTTENQELKPKAEYYDAFAELGNSTTFSRVAKHIGWGVIRFTKQLRRDKILFHQGGINMPYQPYVDKGYFEISMRNDGYGNYREQTRVTAKGVLFLASRYGKATQKLEAKQRLKQLENLELAKGQPGLRLITSAANAKKVAKKAAKQLAKKYAKPAANVERSA